MQREVLNVTGMTCSGCADKVARALQAVSGVRGIDISVREGKAVINFDEHFTSPEELKAAIRHAGYGVESSSTPVRSGRGCCG